MVFKCQEDSFLTEFTSVVISCKESEFKTTVNGKKHKYKGYEVILENTILFPEGGGQPCDLGCIAGKDVVGVWRRGCEAVHFLLEPLEEGTLVIQKVHWERRFDHMQQHTGQHLLSALLENDHKIMTSSWWLGAEECHVELSCDSLSPEIIKQIENKCNLLIRESVPIIVKVCDKNDPSLDSAHTRGLPDDHMGKIRIISIKDIDENLCCGTHCSNLSQLQVIKLIRAESGKKNKTNLRFLVGGRVVSALQKCFDKEQALIALLKNDPSKHVDLVDKLQKALKITTKSLQNTFNEKAVLETDKLKSLEPLPQYYCLHTKDGDSDYMRSVCRCLEGIDIFLFLSVGDGKQGGNILIQGKESYIQELAPKVCEILKGKGAGKGTKYQARAGDLTDITKCEKYISDFFSKQNSTQ